MSGPIPVSVIGGYLGAGKTTLVNHLLRNAQGLKIAVLVNDFGELAIDADLIEAEEDDLISIAGGCVCGSFGSDLMGALVNLRQRDPPPQLVIIETSGVALPGTVALAVRLNPGFRVDAVVVLADAQSVRARAADRFMGDTILRQLNEANLVVLNKTDLINANELRSLHAWLKIAAPGAGVLDAVRAQVPIELLVALLVGPRADRPARAATPRLAPGPIRSIGEAADNYESAAFTPDQALDVSALAAALAQPAFGLLRAKGVLRDVDGSLKTIHVVGARFEVTPHAGSSESATGLACIGARGKLVRAEIQRALAQATTDTTGA